MNSLETVKRKESWDFVKTALQMKREVDDYYGRRLCNRERPLYFTSSFFPTNFLRRIWTDSFETSKRRSFVTKLRRLKEFFRRNRINAIWCQSAPKKKLGDKPPFLRNFSDIAFASQFCDVSP